MIKKILIFITVLALLSTIFLPLLSGLAHAETTTTTTNSTLPTIPQADFLPGPTQGSTGSDVQNYLLNTGIPKGLNIAIGLLGISAFLGILISAMQMLTAYGADDKITRAKTNLRYSLLGFLFVTLAYAIVSIVISVALPNAAQDSNSSFIPSAYAVNVNNDPSLLIPDEKDFIEQDPDGRVSLPNGDFLGQIVPAVITNVLYLVGFLIFIGMTYGGALMVIGRGNEEDLTKAKNIILYSSIALVLVSLGYALIYGIATLNLTQDSTTKTDDAFIDSTTND